LFEFLGRSGLSNYAGTIVPKNGFNSPWSNDLDIRIQQDFRVWNEHTISVFLDIENFLNLISDDNNLKRYADTGDIQEGVRVLEITDGRTDQFVINRFYDEGTDLDVDDSIYRIQVGFRYRF
jgi:hypothetical protein